MTNLPCKPSRIDFEGITRSQIERILSTGELADLTPAERQYYSLMELVRGLRARMTHPGGHKLVTKAGIISLLKSEAYGLSDWMARRVYADAMNFFYADESVSPRAWRNFYAERVDKLIDLCIASGRLKEARAYIDTAARLRGCFEEQSQEIPEELLNPPTVMIYTADAVALGAPAVDRDELERFIDSIPDVPESSVRSVKEDAGILKRNLLDKLAADAKEFGADE